LFVEREIKEEDWAYLDDGGVNLAKNGHDLVHDKLDLARWVK